MRVHPERYGDDRVEAACHRAEHLGSCRYRTVKNILAAGMDRLPLEAQQAPPSSMPIHDNIRGPDYYGKDT